MALDIFQRSYQPMYVCNNLKYILSEDVIVRVDNYTNSSLCAKKNCLCGPGIEKQHFYVLGMRVADLDPVC